MLADEPAEDLLALAVATCCFAGTATAADMTRDQYKAQKDQIEATYKADKKSCDAMKDNAKDVCNKEAKGKENVAKAELEQQLPNRVLKLVDLLTG